MRYYAVKIDSAPSPFQALAGADVPGAQWCSVANGLNDPGVQQVEFDLNEFDASEETPNCTVTIQNPTLLQLSQMAYLKDCPVSVFGGMWKGLPLATYHYSRGLTGFLVSGNIQRAWGSWVGTDMSLSFAFVCTETKATQAQTAAPGGTPGAPNTPTIGPSNAPMSFSRVGPRRIFDVIEGPPSIAPRDITFGSGFLSIGDVTSFLFGGGGTLSGPLNLVHNLMPNQAMSDAIKQTLATAFPGATNVIKISPDLKLPSQDAGIYQSLTQFAAYLRQQSQAILGTQNYLGIRITTYGAGLNVWDGTQGSIGTATTISPYDLIGQPTWIGVNEIQFKCVMRNDIHQGYDATLPPGLAIVEASAGDVGGGSARAGVINFGGITGKVTHVRHVGDLRNPDGNAWCTIVTMTVGPSDIEAGSVGLGQAVIRGALSVPNTPTIGPSMSRSIRRYL